MRVQHQRERKRQPEALRAFHHQSKASRKGEALSISRDKIMAPMISSDDLNETRRRGTPSSPFAATNSKSSSSGRSGSTTKPNFPPWSHKYHHSDQKFPPLPMYYAGPPPPGFYHPYYYHYPAMPGMHFRQQWPTTVLPSPHRSSKKKAVTSATKPNIKSISRNRDGFENTTGKEVGATNDTNESVPSTNSTKKKATSTICVDTSGTGDAILKSPIPLHIPSNLKRRKRPLSPTLISPSSLSLSSAPLSSRKKIDHNHDKGVHFSTKVRACAKISPPKRNGSQIDRPRDSADGSTIPKVSYQTTFHLKRRGKKESTQLPKKKLENVLGMNKKTKYSCGQPDGKNHDRQFTDSPLFPSDLIEGNRIHFNDTRCIIDDANPPFPVDDITVTQDMNLHIPYDIADCTEKEHMTASKDDSNANVDETDFKIISPIVSTKSNEEESIGMIYKINANEDDTNRNEINEVDIDDVGLDPFIRSLISEDDADGLIRPSRGFSPHFASTD